jgi:septum formation protein
VTAAVTRPVRFVLASASPARLQTLRRAGIEPVVIVSGVDEEAVTADSPAQLATLLATLKARAVVAGLDDHAVVLGCDSVLEIDGTAYGKPADAAEAVERLKAMRGRSGVLHTGHCVFDTWGRHEVREVASTTVHFAELTDAEIDAYVATGEPLEVAGAFTVDGLGGAFVEGVEGDHHNVVGISLPLLRLMLASIGITWPELWTANRGVPDYDRQAEGYDASRGGTERARAAARAVHALLPAPCSTSRPVPASSPASWPRSGTWCTASTCPRRCCGRQGSGCPATWSAATCTGCRSPTRQWPR